MISVLMIFTGFMMAIMSWLIGYGLSYTKRFRADPDVKIKNPVFGMDGAECMDEPVRCNDEDIGAYMDIDEPEDGVSRQDLFCSNICSETSLGKNFKCLPASDYAEFKDDYKLHVNDHYCVEDKSNQAFKECNKKYGGVMAWTGKGEADQQGWDCYCNWSQFASTDNCKDLNPNICGGKGTFDWDATQGQSPEDVRCVCDDGYTTMRSLEGKPEICVKNGNKTYYMGLYKEV
jgi:hypothetical protein